MLFNSIVFIFLFLPISIYVYYFLTAHRIIIGARVWLVAASLFFYAYWKLSYLPLILISMAFNFSLGTILAPRHNRVARTIDTTQKRCILAFGIVANLASLAYFKYADFMIDNYNLLFDDDLKHLKIALPLAISFFTFQQIAYLVDSYKGLTKEHDILSYMLFVTFFPQLIAGPIVAHYEMMPQFRAKKNLVLNYRHVYNGIILFVIGLFKKIVIADTFSYYATIGFDKLGNLTMFEGWFTSLSYTLQIYYDFSGYCDMALGCALLFNIKLPINFNSPYKALNIQDFWRRWHITLSRFLRDYLYIPLGGNRRGEAHACANVFTVFLLGGLWHGAAWTFVVWGALHGIANIICRLWHKTRINMPKWMAWMITFNFVNIAWIFFRAKSFSSALKVLKAMFEGPIIEHDQWWRFKYQLPDFLEISSNMIYAVILLIIGCVILPNSLQIPPYLQPTSRKKKIVCAFGLAFVSVGLLCKMIIIPYTEFIYFNF